MPNWAPACMLNRTVEMSHACVCVCCTYNKVHACACYALRKYCNLDMIRFKISFLSELQRVKTNKRLNFEAQYLKAIEYLIDN